MSSALITFANSLDPDQARLSVGQKVGLDLDQNCLAEGIPEGFFSFEKDDFLKKISRRRKNHE